MAVPILKQGDVLIASVQSALSDADWEGLLADLATQVGRCRARGVIIDVTPLDVLDSYATRTLRTLAHVVRLRGASAIIVGIQPDVAFAMAQLGLTSRLAGVEMSLDLEDALEILAYRAENGGAP